jgi:hypothetical protein
MNCYPTYYGPATHFTLHHTSNYDRFTFERRMGTHAHPFLLYPMKYRFILTFT